VDGDDPSSRRPDDDAGAEGGFVDPWIGQDLAGYTIIERIGEGGMGIVYLGRHESLGRLAAIKFLGAHMVDDKAYIERFLHEARGAAKLNHPNIVQVYDAGSMGDNIYYFIMEYIEGKDLGMLLREKRIFSVSEAAGYVRQAAAALGYAHHKQIVHRDVKPDNLMLTADDVIKVGDLGLAKWTGDELEGGATQSGMVMGTPFYISPEQVRGSKHVSARCDVYSLGATFFHLVTGKIPYEGSSPAVIMSMHLSNPVPEPSKINPALDRDICGIIKKMMAKKPDERYQSMEEIDTVLAEYLSRSFHPTKVLTRITRLGGGPRDMGQRSTTITPLKGWTMPAIVESEPGSPTKAALAVAISMIFAAVLMGMTLTSIHHRQAAQKVVAPPIPQAATPAAADPATAP